MVAGPEVGEDDAARRALGDRRRGEDVVEAPADVALAQVAPRRPPGEEVRIVRVEGAADVDQMPAQQLLEELALFLALPDDARLALLRMHVHVGAGDVHVAAQNELAPLPVQLLRPGRELDHEAELRLIVLAAVRYVYRGEDEPAELGQHDARFHVELRMAERGLGVEQALPDVQGHAGVGAKAVPISVVVPELDLLGNLRGLRLQLLQAHHVRVVALHPLAQLHLARADAVDVPGGDFHRGGSAGYVFSRYPVLKIHATIASDTARNTMVMARLTPTLTSASPKKHHRKPLTRYTTGLNSETVCQKGGSMSME